jgi:L-alanine-DL-glutamate epimerase-like enolase superfamily enzyme
MEETSLGIAAAAVLAGLADWVDLDGNLLLADDPFVGLELDEGCHWRLPTAAGVGVRRRTDGRERRSTGVDKSVDEIVDGTGSSR